MTVPTVWIVDDATPIRRSLSRLLRGAGYQTSDYSNGSAALKALKNKRPDLLILDNNLGVENGLDVLRKVMSIEPSLPVMLHCDYPSDETLQEYWDAGISAFIPKPAGQEILNKVRNLLPKEDRDT